MKTLMLVFCWQGDEARIERVGGQDALGGQPFVHAKLASRLGEIADVVLGAENYEEDVRFDGQTATLDVEDDDFRQGQNYYKQGEVRKALECYLKVIDKRGARSAPDPQRAPQPDRVDQCRNQQVQGVKKRGSVCFASAKRMGGARASPQCGASQERGGIGKTEGSQDGIEPTRTNTEGATINR